jgi:hypothetical protein
MLRGTAAAPNQSLSQLSFAIPQPEIDGQEDCSTTEDYMPESHTEDV